MSKIRQYYEKYAAEDFLREIRVGQGSADLMNNRSLSDACGIPYQTLLRRIRNPEDFTLGEIRKLFKVLPMRPAVLLAFVGYTTQDIKKLAKEYSS